jgi:hypothetical protein
MARTKKRTGKNKKKRTWKTRDWSIYWSLKGETKKLGGKINKDRRKKRDEDNGKIRRTLKEEYEE